jgi:transposase-like protein
MDALRFAELKAEITGEATAEQCLELEELVRKISAEKQGEMVVARRSRALDQARKCPHCGHLDVVKHGVDGRSAQRFRCRQSPGGGCGKTFNVFTGTPLARMRKPQEWARYASLMATRFVSIDAIRDTGIDISRLTAWRWRHRLLKLQAERQSETLSGVIEADETFFRSSFKGSRLWKRGNPPENRPPRYRGGPAMTAGLSSEQIPVLTAIAANGESIEAVLANRADIGPTLSGRIASGSVLCSDGLPAYVKVAVDAGSEHRRVQTPKMDYIKKAKGGKPRRKGRLGLGHVNAHHERMKTFVNREARGVSTRYLHLYVGWLRASRRPGFNAETLLSEAISTSK